MSNEARPVRGGSAQLTARGWLVVAGGTVLLLSGTLLGYRELVVLGAAACVVVLLALALVGRLRPMATWRVTAVSRVSPGDEVEVALGASGDGWGRPAQFLADYVRGPSGVSFVEVPVRLWASPSISGYRVTAQRRGVLDFGPVESRRRDPLGLVTARRASGSPERVWVHPRWETLPAMPVGRADDPQGILDGGGTGSVSFHALREYVPGDDVRHIHWRSTARHGRLIVREHVDTSHARITVVADDRAGAVGDALDALDEVASTAAAVCAAAVDGRWSCELSLVSGRSSESTGTLIPILDLLAEAEVDTEAHLLDALWRLRRKPDSDTLVLVSASLSATEARSFGELADCYSRLVLVFLHHGGTPLGGVSGVTVINASDAEELALQWSRQWWSS